MQFIFNICFHSSFYYEFLWDYQYSNQALKANTRPWFIVLLSVTSQSSRKRSIQPLSDYIKSAGMTIKKSFGLRSRVLFRPLSNRLLKTYNLKKCTFQMTMNQAYFPEFIFDYANFILHKWLISTFEEIHLTTENWKSVLSDPSHTAFVLNCLRIFLINLWEDFT